MAKKLIEHYSFSLTDKLGRGFSSTVYKGKDTRTNSDVAVKVIEMKLIDSDPVYKQLLHHQTEVLKALTGHPNVLPLLDSYCTTNNTYLMTQCCESDLAKILKQRKQFSLAEAVKVMVHVLTGYLAVHELGYVHRDLKPANIFIGFDGSYKIADFGFAVPLSELGAHKKYNVGSPMYMPPEALKGNSYGFSSDLWAIGVILFELLRGHTPWNARSEISLYQKMMLEPIDQLVCEIPEEVREFLLKTLRIEPLQRPTPEEARAWLSYFKNLEEKLETNIFAARRCDSTWEAQAQTVLKQNNQRVNRLLSNLRENPQKIGQVQLSPNKNKNINNYFIKIPETRFGSVSKQKPVPQGKIRRTSVLNSSSSKNPEASSPTSSAEAKIRSLLNYCKFIYRVIQLVNSPLKYEFPSMRAVEGVLSNVLNTKVRTMWQQFQYPSSNPLSIQDWELFSIQKNQLFEALKTKASKCLRKYGMLYPATTDFSKAEWESILKSGIHQLMDFLEEPCNFDEKSVLIGDYLTTLYQLFELDRKYDWSRFPSISKIDLIVDVNPYSATVEHLDRLRNKLDIIGI